MDIIEVIGFIAAACTTLAFVPQVIKTWTTKHTKDLSLGLFVVLSTGVFLWLIYGLLITSWPIIIANILTLILSLILLGLKLRYK
ncbi:SemiSWEET transporter [Candidatus Woesearchaeota archaeon]|nr:SemiSWEET transporter [Candidatus Woesearchaeota archaeon]